MSLHLSLVAPEDAIETVACICQCGHQHTKKVQEVYLNTNMTHNLINMFAEAGIHDVLWRGDGLIAGDILDMLKVARKLMKAEPERFKAFDAPNGWGTYPQAMKWLEEVVQACSDYPKGVLQCSV